MHEVKIYVDGGCRHNGQPDAEGYYSFRIIGSSDKLVSHDMPDVKTNNTAEYQALIEALIHVNGVLLAHPCTDIEFHVYMDSALVIHQVRGEWKCKAAHLRPLHSKAMDCIADIESRQCKVCLHRVPKETHILPMLGH